MSIRCTLVKLGFIISYALRGTGSGKSILLLWIMAEVILFRSQELDSSFLIFGEAQDLGTVFMVTNLAFCPILAKAATPSMAESYGLFGDLFLEQQTIVS